MYSLITEEIMLGFVPSFEFCISCFKALIKNTRMHVYIKLYYVYTKFKSNIIIFKLTAVGLSNEGNP